MDIKQPALRTYSSKISREIQILTYGSMLTRGNSAMISGKSGSHDIEVYWRPRELGASQYEPIGGTSTSSHIYCESDLARKPHSI